MLRTMSRLTVGGYVKLLMLPADAVVRLAEGANGGTGGAVSARLALDRVEAALRGAAGTVLNDRVLREDARRRAEAADERQRALKLRRAADRRSEEADERLSARRDQAERVREVAEQDAERKRAQARRERDAKKARAAKTAQRRKRAARQSAERAKQAGAKQAQRERLEALDTKSDALQEKETAISASDESRRLKAAAARAKAARKDSW
jgi:colicin import membrane protein